MSTKTNTKATSTVSSISDYIGRIISKGETDEHLETYGHMLCNLIALDPDYLDAVESNPRYNPSHQIIYMGVLTLCGLEDHVFKITKRHVLDCLSVLTLPTVIRILKTVPNECEELFDMSFYADICEEFSEYHARAIEDAMGGDLFEYNKLFNRNGVMHAIDAAGNVHPIGLEDSHLSRWDQIEFISPILNAPASKPLVCYDHNNVDNLYQMRTVL